MFNLNFKRCCNESTKSTRMTQEELDRKLFQACRDGCVHRAENAIQEGANVNAKDYGGKTPLHWAVRYGHFHIIEFLFENGAKVDAVDEDGNTTIHVAAWYGYLYIAKYLIKYGANVNAKDRYGKTPLDDAVKREHTEVAKYLRQVMESKPIQHNVKCGNFEISIHIKQIETA